MRKKDNQKEPDFLNEVVNEGDRFVSADGRMGYTIQSKKWTKTPEGKDIGFVYGVKFLTGETGSLPEQMHRINVVNLRFERFKKKK